MLRMLQMWNVASGKDTDTSQLDDIMHPDFALHDALGIHVEEKHPWQAVHSREDAKKAVEVSWACLSLCDAWCAVNVDQELVCAFMTHVSCHMKSQLPQLVLVQPQEFTAQYNVIECLVSRAAHSITPIGFATGTPRPSFNQLPTAFRVLSTRTTWPLTHHSHVQCITSSL